MKISSQTNFRSAGGNGIWSNARENYDINLALGIADCIIEGRTALYVATPITSGRRLWDLAKRLAVRNLDEISGLYPQLFDQEVFGPNLSDARQMVGAIRARFFQPVIDPSRLVVREWTQEQYRRAWRAVISKKVSILIVANGWEYSIGCAEEVLCAVENQIPILDQSDTRLSINDLSSAVARALAEALEINILVGYLVRAQDFLKSGTI